MRKVLACVDGSDLSGPVIREAFLLAREGGAESVEVLHVVDRKVESPLLSAEHEGLADPEEGIRGTVRERLGEFVGEVTGPEGPPVPWSVNAIFGSPYKAIVKRAGEEDFDLVVMGHRGLKGLNRFLLGSVAAKVVAYAPCHVLILRSEATEKPRKVMVAVDGGETSADVAGFGLDHALNSGAKEVLFVNVIEDLSEVRHAYWGSYTAEPEFYARESQQACEELAKILEEVSSTRNVEGVELNTEIAKGTIHATILRVAETEAVDLIVVGDRAKRGFEGFLLGSVSAKIVRYAHCGVLVYRTGHEKG